MTRGEDGIVNVLSRWLARHVGDEEVRTELERLDRDQLSPDQAEAVEELRAELEAEHDRNRLERAVRETLEALALG